MDYRNAQSAFLMQAAEILSHGHAVSVRGALTREVLNRTLTLQRPLERCIVIPGRNNNPFAAIYETLWVLAGRNDIGDLAEYLPRAKEFSDDGTTWRAGYGPRLRAWNGVDQLAAVAKTLADDIHSRRAVISIFDPALDNQPSKDIPCTNWLQFTCREGVLDLAVTVRSNDLVWGFSGINTFEWSVLHEMMAFWTGARTGSVTYFVGSLHLYERHFDRVGRLLGNALTDDPYASGAVPLFATPITDLDAVLAQWFDLEAEARKVRRLSQEDITTVGDPLLREFLTMVNEYWAYKRGESAHFDDITDSGLRAAATEFVNRGDPANIDGTAAKVYLADFVYDLHRGKSDAYGDSWKRRGELLSILPNVARKIDRLERLDLDNGAPLVTFDTAIDLFVYAVKYRTFLADTENRPELESWSDGTDGFEIVAARVMDTNVDTLDLQIARMAVLNAYGDVELHVYGGDADAVIRAVAVDALVASAWTLLSAIVQKNPWVVREASAELAKFVDWKS